MGSTTRDAKGSVNYVVICTQIIVEKNYKLKVLSVKLV